MPRDASGPDWGNGPLAVDFERASVGAPRRGLRRGVLDTPRHEEVSQSRVVEHRRWRPAKTDAQRLVGGRPWGRDGKFVEFRSGGD